MSDLRTAAQQALEALELAQTDVHWELNSPTRKFLRKAEKTLRAALAQKDEPVWMHPWPPVRAQQDEPVEPVAWIQPDHLQKARIAPFLCRVEPTQRCADFVPLYLSPPQRKPLTEEEIDAEWRELDGEVSPMFMRVLRKFARAIERAHGIGETK